uniref:Ig-like domain-containing protein n=1 Tax=Astyanax mexicanus TaxID=7994 RepID=A0A3B1IS81_ASTMX
MCFCSSHFLFFFTSVTYFYLILSAALTIDIVSLNGNHYVPFGGKISLNCIFSSSTASTAAWLQQTPGGKPLLIASGYHFNPVLYHNGFDKSNRFYYSATYYCAVIHYTDVAVGDWTVSVVKDAPSSLYTVLQPPVSDPVRLGGDTTLQCSILTDNSAGDHSVYWFRHGSGESDPGIIFTHGNRSDQCKKSSETVSPTQSCIYKLPKNNLSLSDAGTYYCAVAACGHIFFGNGTKLDLIRGKLNEDLNVINFCAKEVSVKLLDTRILIQFLFLIIKYTQKKQLKYSNKVNLLFYCLREDTLM